MIEGSPQVRDGRVAQWVALGGVGDKPYRVFEGKLAQLAFEVARLPSGEDLTPRLIRAAAERLSAGDRTAISFRFLLDPAQRRRLRVFVLVRAAAESPGQASDTAARLAEEIRGTFGEDLPLVVFEPKSGEAGPTNLAWVQSVVEVRRTELGAPSSHEPSITGFSYSYSPVPLGSLRNAPPLELWTNLAASARISPLMVEISLTPSEILSRWELDASKRLAALFKVWGDGQRVEIPGGVFSDTRTLEYAPDRAAAAAVAGLNEVVSELSRPPLIAYAIRLLSGDTQPPVTPARDLIAGIGGSGRFCVQPVRREDPLFSRCIDASEASFSTPSARADLWVSAGAPEHLARLHRLIPISLVGGMLPIPSASTPGATEFFGRVERDEAPPSTLADVLGKFPRWAEDSTTELSIPFGWLKDASRAGVPLEERTAFLRFGDGSEHALLGGKTGSGKSVLLHDVIVAASHRYSPDELALYLIDLKQGVEFRLYRDLPHAKVLAIESESEFTVNVLVTLVAEMNRRNDLFADAGVRDFEGYRRLRRETLPRILLIIDEFQTLFEPRGGRGSGDPLPLDAVRELERIATKGRSAGVHMLLSTQSYAWEGGTWLSKKTTDNAAIRIAMKLSDSRQAYELLTRKPESVEELESIGEGLLEAPYLRDDNLHFRALFQPSNEEYEALLRDVVSDLDEDGHGPYVFEGRRPPDFEAALSRSVTTDFTFGQALDAGGTHVGFDLDRNSRAAHVLLCGALQPALACNVLGLCVQFLRREMLSRGRVLLGSTYSFPSEVRPLVEKLEQWAGDRVEVAIGGKHVARMLEGCAKEVRDRAVADDGDEFPPILFVPFEFTSLRCLAANSYPPPAERECFGEILQEGAQTGVFVLAATASWPSVTDLLTPVELGVFGARVGLTLPDASRVVNAYNEFIELPPGYAVGHFPVAGAGWVRFRTFPGEGVENWLHSAAMEVAR